MSDQQAIIEMLSADMRDEHAAIVQYLQHAYAIGESGEAAEIEGIAREEMRHFDWLAEAIVELGGEPDITRGNVDMAGGGPVEWMARDVQAEERAVAQYKQHIAAIDDAKVKRLLRRILSDEESHRGTFVGLQQELAEEGATATGPLEARSAEGAPPHVLDILQEGVQHEYTVILQYLFHNFVMPHCEVGRELEMRAINEMQHMGWLAEELAELGAHPEIEQTKLALEGDAADMLQADIDAERAVTLAYTRQLNQIEDEDLHQLVTRIRDHEIFHEEVFRDLLAEVEEAAPGDVETAAEADEASSTACHFTVGSLMEKD